MSESQQTIRLDERALRLLRRRRRTRFVLLALLLAILAVVFAARVRPGTSATDHDRFHQREFRVIEARAGDRLLLEDDRSRQFTVCLIGADANGAEPARQHAEALRGQTVMLYLEPAPTRNQAGDLLAYVYTKDLLFNGRLIEEGLAFADRRWDYSFARQFFQLEEHAQARRAGLWADMTEGQMPGWRQRWLAEMRKEPWERQPWRWAAEP